MNNLCSMKNILINGFVLKINNELNNNPTEEKLLHLIKCINEVKDKYPEKSSYLDDEFNEKLSKCYDDLKRKMYDEYLKYCHKYFKVNQKSLNNVSLKELNAIVEDGKKLDLLDESITKYKVDLSKIFIVEKIIMAPSHFIPWLRSEEMIEKDIAIVERNRSFEELNDFEKIKVKVIRSKILDIELQIEKIIHNRKKEL